MDNDKWWKLPEIPDQCNDDNDNTLVIKEQWPREIIDNACRYGFIHPFFLAHLLGAEDQYDNIIPKLWDIFKLSPKKRLRPLSTPSRRVEAWLAIIQRWAINDSIEELLNRLGESGANQNVPRMYPYNDI